MTKTEAILHFGGTVNALAAACGVTGSAVTQWPEELPYPFRAQVQAALYREKNRIPHPLPRAQRKQQGAARSSLIGTRPARLKAAGKKSASSTARRSK